MSDLTHVLERLGLSSYTDALVENGFRNWETVLDITEEDLTALKFKLGHRRALQREIATYRGLPSTLALDDGNAPDQTALSTSALETLTRQTSTTLPREKRRYRRHPRPDSNAPKKPKTACMSIPFDPPLAQANHEPDVNFADQLRTDPEISSLSFVDIAREVGRRWQQLPPEQKRIWESHAARTMQEYEAQMDEYKKTDSWRKYQAYLIDFKAQQQSSSKVSSRPSQSRTTTSSSYSYTPMQECSRASPSESSEGPTSLNSSATSLGTEAEVCHNALTLAFSELVSLRGEILGQSVRPYDAQNLPPEGLVKKAMYAFVQGTGSLLYMWTYAQVDEILDRIYRPQKPIDAMTLAECFTVAAMGAHYDLDCFPDRIRRILYASGTLCFNEQTARFDYLRTMRLLLATAFYALLEKHMSARYVIVAGLQIARWKCPALANKIHDSSVDTTVWRRLFRSLIFMDCWLSYTLGYTSEVTPQDIAMACAIPPQNEVPLDEQIHVQTSKIGLVAADISKAIASPESTTRETIQTLADKLEIWRIEVPSILSIASLTSSSPPPMTLYQRRAILMVHIMYLGAVILLYRHLLMATAETHLTDGASWSLNISIHDAKRYRNECALAGQQVARILGLISFDGTLTKRCWLIIYWAFTASIVLLHSATNSLLQGQFESVDQDLAYGKACMDMLEPCRAFEPIAARYLDILWPLYDNLRNIQHRMIGRAKTSIYALLQGDPMLSPPIPVAKAEMGPISEKLSALLTDPFGRSHDLGDNSMRRILNGDGSCSVFWWK